VYVTGEIPKGEEGFLSGRKMKQNIKRKTSRLNGRGLRTRCSIRSQIVENIQCQAGKSQREKAWYI